MPRIVITHISEELRDRFKAYCYGQGKDMRGVVIECMEKLLKESEGKRR